MLRKIPRYRVPWFLTCAVACASAANTTQLPEIRHVVFILVDDLGWADVGYNGRNVNSYIETPTIDALSEEGVRLDNYYVNQLCSPTRTSLLSGRYAYTIGTNVGLADGAPSHLPRSVSTIGDRLKAAGWATAAFGKWDIGFTYWGCTPLCRGFDHFYGFYGASKDHFHHTAGGGLDFRNDSDIVWNRDGVYFDEDIAEEHIRWITEMNSHHPEHKTFAYHAHQAVHAPLQVPERYLIRGSCGQIPEEHPSRKIMCGMMGVVDDTLANLTSTYKNLGLWDTTVVIFSSDNGGNTDQGGNNYPLRGSKGTTFEGGIRAVGWVGGGWPGIHRRTTSPAMIHVSDWYPTIVEGIAGLQVNIDEDGFPWLDGISAWSAISEGAPSSRNEMLLNLIPTGSFAHRKSSDMTVTGQGAIRVGQWKLLHGFTTVWVQASDTFGGGSCSARDGHVPNLFETALPISEETSPPFCPSGWVPPPESNAFPVPPPDEEGVNCQGALPCFFTESPLIVGGTLLFDIEADPYEQHNLASVYPDIVVNLLARLQEYNSTNILQQHPKRDRESSPKHWNGILTPWRGNRDPEACDWESPPETYDFSELFNSMTQMNTSMSKGQKGRDRRKKQGRKEVQTNQIEFASDADKSKNAQSSLKADTTARHWAFEYEAVDLAWRLLSWWSLSISGVGVSFVAGPISFSGSWSQLSSVLPSWCSRS